MSLETRLAAFADRVADQFNTLSSALTSGLAGKQPLDSDLTTIAALDSSTAGALVTDGSGWIRKTYAQLKTALSLTKSDVGLGNVDNTSNATERAAVRTLTNARITKRVVDITSTATLTHDADSYDQANITAQAAALTIANPSGTPTSGQPFILRIKDNNAAKAISYGSQWRGIGLTLPTTTVAGKLLYLGAAWNAADSKWDVIALRQEA